MATSESTSATGNGNTSGQNDSPQPSETGPDNPNVSTMTHPELITLVRHLVDRVAQLTEQVAIVANKPSHDVTTDAIHHQNTELAPTIDTNPIVGETTTRSEEQRLRSLYSKFTPSKVSQRFAKHTIDQLESWMDINKIDNDHDRFLLLKMNIEPETYQQVASALATKHPGKEYDNLKKAIIQAFTDSEAKQIQNLLSGIKLGDRRPTQLLAEMCGLYNGPKDKIFEELFLSRLPGNVRGILVGMRSQDDSPKSIESIAQRADTILEQISVPPMINAITDSEQICALQDKMDNMINAFSSTTNSRFKKPFQARSFRSRNHDTNKENGEATVCYFHRKFGNNRHENTKCMKFCKLHNKWKEAREKFQKN